MLTRHLVQSLPPIAVTHAFARCNEPLSTDIQPAIHVDSVSCDWIRMCLASSSVALTARLVRGPARWSNPRGPPKTGRGMHVLVLAQYRRQSALATTGLKPSTRSPRVQLQQCCTGPHLSLPYYPPSYTAELETKVSLRRKPRWLS
ncbi:hypothetical protein PHYSODRAFT_305906 [Phytophthora sojae]|uniref:Uncharacterized protein n=1 Tax=Phytophthora sojae (strain P6497) TaxID=1094619 RepID=G5A763_PHYSP|nr:hypothetical protein PHYSODRAFT_305906 [Phytophthora sojae]EGZ09168.1 hypothetical protein PHYSODRAFT_305906 [Phytophthora sojae]|eukprot:XP_009535801.1 hypothetical protein PHYSODRAFT_305906 [Phytophthora sojae]